MNSQKNAGKVVVAMSGGVDSSVAAALLVKAGYEVIGMMMRLWSEPSVGASPMSNRCCTPDQVADARRIADNLDIPFYVLDTQAVFRRKIVQFFIDEHVAGRTPNPCIECNRHIRFDYLLNQAKMIGVDYLATGHYARVRHTATGYQLLKGLDHHKDQSYVLHVLGQAELAQVMFPVGELSKPEVRQIAAELELGVASKSDSMDLCFLGDGDYRRFLHEHAPATNQTGAIISQDGTIWGQHQGLAAYTIGQRKGLGFSAPQPMFVIDKDIERNVLIVGQKSETGRTEFNVRQLNWMAEEMPASSLHANVKIRYKAKEMPALVTPQANNKAHVKLEQPLAGITPGQGAVFYEGDLCLGGGLII